MDGLTFITRPGLLPCILLSRQLLRRRYQQKASMACTPWLLSRLVIWNRAWVLLANRCVVSEFQWIPKLCEIAVSFFERKDFWEWHHCRVNMPSYSELAKEQTNNGMSYPGLRHSPGIECSQIAKHPVFPGNVHWFARDRRLRQSISVWDHPVF